MNLGSVYFSNTWSIFRMILSAPLHRGRNRLFAAILRGRTILELPKAQDEVIQRS
jgi:hypothetical protein